MPSPSSSPSSPSPSRSRRPDRRAFMKLAVGTGVSAGVASFWSGGAGAAVIPPLPPPPRPFAPGPAQRAKAAARSCILLYMEGGPSQLDTWDPKPGRATGGEFKAIESAVSGIRVSEHLPRLARQMKRLCVIRSLTSKEGNHDRARHLMHTGYPPQGGVDHPAFGSLMAEARSQKAPEVRHLEAGPATAPAGSSPSRMMPGYVSIGGPGEDAGFLGAVYSPFPVLNPGKPTRNINIAKGIDESRFGRRLELWRGLQEDFATSRPSPLGTGQREVGERAVELMRAPGAVAFDISHEPESVKQAYGATDFGAGCLMARRLVEQGVGFVEVMLKGWDTHDNNFPRVKQLSSVLDQTMSALLDDLAARGLLESTLVLWLGDFGRTPRINERGGRDHFPMASAVVLAGGGVRGGQAIGATSADGDEITARPVTVPDLYRSLAQLLDLDADKTRFAPSGRPLKTVDGGQLISELF